MSLNKVVKPFILKNGILIKKVVDSEKFLLESHRGAYTAARTIKTQENEIFVFDLKDHVKRLANSCKIMIKDELKENEIPKHFETITDENLLKQQIVKILETGLTLDESTEETKITILITWDKDIFDISIHFSDLGSIPSKNSLSIEMIPGSRSHITAKDSEWIRYRKLIESMKKDKKSNEIVLVDQEGLANEGLSSNFFVVMNDNSIWTANEGIISGTVRSLILKVCDELNIKVVLKSPQVKDIKHWKEIFISSTSRLLLPIPKLYFHETKTYFDGNFDKKDLNIEESNAVEYNFETDFSSNLSKQVKERLLEMSEKII
jgi:branched-subunit amino acid aminotransferase/4-amino-4-deoxychorismate lyase